MKKQKCIFTPASQSAGQNVKISVCLCFCLVSSILPLIGQKGDIYAGEPFTMSHVFFLGRAVARAPISGFVSLPVCHS